MEVGACLETSTGQLNGIVSTDKGWYAQLRKTGNRTLEYRYASHMHCVVHCSQKHTASGDVWSTSHSEQYHRSCHWRHFIHLWSFRYYVVTSHCDDVSDARSAKLILSRGAAPHQINNKLLLLFWNLYTCIPLAQIRLHGFHNVFVTVLWLPFSYRICCSFCIAHDAFGARCCRVDCVSGKLQNNNNFHAPLSRITAGK